MKLGTYSLDVRLVALLRSALGSEYAIKSDINEHNLSKILGESDTVDVLIFDFDTNYSNLDSQLELYDRIGDSTVPIIVMTDDVRRSTALEFLRRGAFDCIRKPPSLMECKVVIGRAHDLAQMRRELETMRQTVNLVRGYGQLVGSSRARPGRLRLDSARGESPGFGADHRCKRNRERACCARDSYDIKPGPTAIRRGFVWCDPGKPLSNRSCSVTNAVPSPAARVLGSGTSNRPARALCFWTRSAN